MAENGPIDRFGDKIGCTDFKSAINRLHVFQAGYHDHRHISEFFAVANTAQKLHTGHGRHVPIHNGKVHGLFLEYVPCFKTIGSKTKFRTVVQYLKHTPNGFTHVFHVIHNEYAHFFEINHEFHSVIDIKESNCSTTLSMLRRLKQVSIDI